MHRLILLRHAKSDRPVGLADEDRPLSEKGERASEAVGRFLAEEDLVPDFALVSPSRRTRETFELLRAGAGRDIPSHEDRRIYGGGARGTLETIRQTGDGVGSLLVVGHNPGIHELALALIDDRETNARERLRDGFPTAALAVIDFPVSRWSEIAEQGGTLERFDRPAK